MASRGAYVMGRNMFGPVRGEWDSDWRGWWGDEPPYHAPVFVLTQRPREPVAMRGGTTAVPRRYGRHCQRARLMSSCSTSRRSYSAAASGYWTASRIPALVPVDVVSSPHATHIRYRVGR